MSSLTLFQATGKKRCLTGLAARSALRERTLAGSVGHHVHCTRTACLVHHCDSSVVTDVPLLGNTSTQMQAYPSAPVLGVSSSTPGFIGGYFDVGANG